MDFDVYFMYSILYGLDLMVYEFVGLRKLYMYFLICGYFR